MNKKIVTAFLAALLAVSAVGCGNDANQGADSTPADTKATEATTTAATTTAAETTTTTAAADSLTAEEAEKKVEENIDNAQKAVKGELEGSYKVITTYNAPKDKDIKPVTLTMEVKQKDKLTGMNYAIGYDSKDLLTVNAVYDNEKETAYAVIPELSDGVLTGTSEEIKNMVSNSVTPMAQTAASTATGNAEADDAQAATAAVSAASVPDMEALKNIDVQALSEDITTYVDTFKENFPEATDGKDYVVSDGGVEITLKTKSYVVTPEDSQKLSKAISDKALADKTLKDVFTAAGATEENYKSIWDSFAQTKEDAETTYFDVYYNADESPVGFAKKSDEKKVEQFFVIASDEKNIIIDSKLGDQTSDKDIKGHFTYENQTLNGKMTVTNKTQDYNKVATFEYKDLTVSGNTVVGDAIFTSSADGTESIKVPYSFDMNDNGGTMEMKAKVAGEDMGTVKTEVQKTDASDITVPTGTTFKMADQESLQKYTESCNVEGWQEDVKKALGDELYEKVFGAPQADDAAVATEEVPADEKASKKKSA